MTLQDLAKYYQIQMVDCIYQITTQNNCYNIISFPRNFYHLTGIQRTKEFKNVNDVSQFYFDCVNGTYTNNLNQYSYLSKSSRNIVLMKSVCFPVIQQTILQCDKIYHIQEQGGDCGKSISTLIQFGKKQKYSTIIFKSDKQLNDDYYIPASIQLDQDLSKSIASKAYNIETVETVKCYSRNDSNIQQIICNSNKQEKH